VESARALTDSTESSMSTTVTDDADDAVLQLQLQQGNVIVVNELLCLLKQKCNVMAFDDLVQLCVDFYTYDEVETSREVMSRYVGQKQLGKLHGTEKDVKSRTLTAMTKICMDPGIQLPTFGAADLSRIPPLDGDHVDVSAALQELSALRRAVPAMSQLKREVEQLKSMLELLKAKSTP